MPHPFLLPVIGAEINDWRNRVGAVIEGDRKGWQSGKLAGKVAAIDRGLVGT